MDSVSLKRCSRCKESKPLSEFTKNRKSKDGLGAYCRPCATAKRNEWREKHPERDAENRRRWQEENRRYAADRHRGYVEAHRDEINEYQRKRRLENPEAAREWQRNHRAKDPESAREKEREYYARTKERRRERAREKYYRNKQDPLWREREWARLNHLSRVRYDHVGGVSEELAAYSAMLRKQPCEYCGANPGGEIDHVIPLSRGGLHVLENLAPCCRSCNRSKSDKTAEEFMAWRKRRSG